MTFREKLMREHPECVDSRLVSGCQGCPSHYGYEPEFCCGHMPCKDCWSRETPMTPEEQAAQEKHDLEINAEIILSYCNRHQTCRECPADDACRKGRGTWLDGSTNTSAAKQRAMLDAFEAALPPLDADDDGRPQAAPTEDNAAVERERLDYLYWNAQAEMTDWYETRDGEELEQAVWLLRWMMEIQEGEGWA